MERWALFDSDGHVRETDADLIEYMPQRYRDRREATMYMPMLPMHTWHRQASGVAGARPTRDASSGFLIPTAADWSHALDVGGLEGAALFGTRIAHIGQLGSPEYAADIAHAYNDWLYDRFLRIDPRLKGVAALPLQDPQAAVAELRRCVKELGFVAGLLPAEGLPRPLGHPEHLPVFEEADRLGCSLAVHSAGSLRDHTVAMWVDEAATLHHVIPIMRQFTNLVFSGVIGRLPNLRVSFLEAGSGWVAGVISKLDERIRRYDALHPDELIARGQLYFHCAEERSTRRDVEILGEDCLIWASDYPHEGVIDIRRPVDDFFEREDLSESAKRKIGRENAMRLYGINEAHHGD